MRPGQGLFLPNLPGPGAGSAASIQQVRKIMGTVQRLERDVQRVEHGLTAVMTSASWMNAPTTGGGTAAASALGGILPTPARLAVQLAIKAMQAYNQDFAESQDIRRQAQDMSNLRNNRMFFPAGGGEYERNRRFQAVATDNANVAASQSFAESTNTTIGRFKEAIGFTAEREAKIASYKKLRYDYQDTLRERGYTDVQVLNKTEQVEKTVEKVDRQNAARRMINANAISSAAYETVCAIAIATGAPIPDPVDFINSDPTQLASFPQGPMQALEAQAKAERLARAGAEEQTVKIRQLEANAQGYWRATHTAEGQQQLWQARSASFLFGMVNHPGIPAVNRS